MPAPGCCHSDKPRAHALIVSNSPCSLWCTACSVQSRGEVVTLWCPSAAWYMSKTALPIENQEARSKKHVYPACLDPCSCSRFEVVHGGPGDDTYIVPVKPSRSADTTSPIRPGSGNDAGAGASPTGVTPPRTPSVQAPSGDRGNAVRTAPRNSQYSANATSAGIASGVSGPSLIPLPDAAGQDLTNVLATPAPAANTSTAVLTRNVTALLPAVGGVSTAANGSSNISSVDGAWSGGCLNYAGYPSSRALWVQLCQ